MRSSRPTAETTAVNSSARVAGGPKHECETVASIGRDISVVGDKVIWARRVVAVGTAGAAVVAAPIYGFNVFAGIFVAIPLLYLAWAARRIPRALYAPVYVVLVMATVAAGFLAAGSPTGGAAFTLWLGPAEMALVLLASESSPALLWAERWWRRVRVRDL